MSIISSVFGRSASKIGFYSHFHRAFPFSSESNWIFPCSFIDSLESNDVIRLPRGRGSVEDFRKYMPAVSDSRFAQIFGQQALEYWLYKNTPNCDFIGCSTYRRYLLISEASANSEPVVLASPSAENLAALTSDEQHRAALYYLQSADVITNRSRVLAVTIQQQYLDHQLAEYWHLMMEAIEKLFPSYRPHMLWFKDYNCINYDTTYIMRRKFFLKYASELFSILEYVFRNASIVVPDDILGESQQPCRYPGFLGERFFPFFIYANSLRKIEVPLVFVTD